MNEFNEWINEFCGWFDAYDTGRWYEIMHHGCSWWSWWIMDYVMNYKNCALLDEL